MNVITDTIEILKAEYIRDYVIRFFFSDGTKMEIDFYPFLSKPNQNPMTAKYLDVIKFRKFKIVRKQDISWNDYEMCFPFETLYSGKF